MPEVVVSGSTPDDGERKKREDQERIADDVRVLMRAHEVRADGPRYRAARRYIDSLHGQELGGGRSATDTAGRRAKRRRRSSR